MSLSIALIHHPVLGRHGDILTTTITNLDLHDMARSARTYGVERFFVTHPVEAQRELATRIRDHWVEGAGGKRIPPRVAALERLRIVASLDDARAALGGDVAIWTTAARASRGTTTFAEARRVLDAEKRPVLLCFGTGWGLTAEMLESADLHLEPIAAAEPTGFNHLSVRAACAIALDRLRG